MIRKLALALGGSSSPSWWSDCCCLMRWACRVPSRSPPPGKGLSPGQRPACLPALVALAIAGSGGCLLGDLIRGGGAHVLEPGRRGRGRQPGNRRERSAAAGGLGPELRPRDRGPGDPGPGTGSGRDPGHLGVRLPDRLRHRRALHRGPGQKPGEGPVHRGAGARKDGVLQSSIHNAQMRACKT